MEWRSLQPKSQMGIQAQSLLPSAHSLVSPPLLLFCGSRTVIEIGQHTKFAEVRDDNLQAREETHCTDRQESPSI